MNSSSQCLNGETPAETHCVQHSPSINGIFSVFSNKNEKHGSTFRTSRNTHSAIQNKRKLNLQFQSPASRQSVKFPTVVIFEDTKHIVADWRVYNNYHHHYMGLAQFVAIIITNRSCNYSTNTFPKL